MTTCISIVCFSCQSKFSHFISLSDFRLMLLYSVSDLICTTAARAGWSCRTCSSRSIRCLISNNRGSCKNPCCDRWDTSRYMISSARIELLWWTSYLSGILGSRLGSHLTLHSRFDIVFPCKKLFPSVLVLSLSHFRELLLHQSHLTEIIMSEHVHPPVLILLLFLIFLRTEKSCSQLLFGLKLGIQGTTRIRFLFPFTLLLNDLIFSLIDVCRIVRIIIFIMVIFSWLEIISLIRIYKHSSHL